ncbi:FAD-dependent monooxygenase [Streptosporangium longisporum]|uniref:FAD-dependent monooxygenase n=1 Tax=Streptosporangium longisporum TaxID=46187 RepID=A0ABN3YED0_9ACTN
MTNNGNVLISGASVAGPALAHWLLRYGFRPTVVERAPALRDGGYAVDFRGPAVDVLERMGVMAEVRRHSTRMGDATLIGPDGLPYATLPSTVFSGELEILKGDLTRVLYDLTRDRAEYVFGDSVTALSQDADGVRADFERGEPRVFDLVVGADGLHSVVRSLAFGPEARYLRPLGLYGGVFTTANYLGLDHSGLLYSAPGKSVNVFSARSNTEARVSLSFAADGLAYDRHDTGAQKRIVAERFADDGWEIPRLLRLMDEASDFWFDTSAQVRMDGWSDGRIVLLGDAAHCAAPTSGLGTSQALVGAYVLAGELASAHGGYREAFDAYEREMRAYVEGNQLIGEQVADHLFGVSGRTMPDVLAEPVPEETGDRIRLKTYPA